MERIAFRLLLPASVILSLFSASCVMSPPVSEQDKVAAKSFTPPAGMAQLYVYRPSSISTMTAATRCWINGNYIGKNGSGNFMAVPLKPGNYTINPIGDPNTEAGRSFPTFKISAVAGSNYFIRQKITPTTEGMVILPTGVVPGLRFEAVLVSDAIGRQEVEKCRQVGFNPKF